MSDPPGPQSRLTAVFAVVTLPLGILAWMFFGTQAAIAVFVAGWLLLVPASAVLFGPTAAEEMDDLAAFQDAAERVDDGASDDATDPIDELRDRYARGEIDEAELERRLDALLETEGLDPSDEASLQRARDSLDTESAAGGRGSDDADVELEPE